MNDLRRNPSLSPQEVERVGRVYQSAFAGPPWFEVSKCASPTAAETCEGGFSPQKVGELCLKCGLIVAEQAYPMEELTKSITERLQYPGATIYEEFNDSDELLVAAIFWEASTEFLGQEKYADVPAMQDWLMGNLPSRPVIWLDEIFADRDKRPKGNLWNFANLVDSVFAGSTCDLMAFRTINEGLLAKTMSVFGDRSKVLAPGQVPDRRSFVTIERNNNE